MLNDKVIDAAQTIMKKQFNDSPKINGFQSAIFKQNTKHFKKIDKEKWFRFYIEGVQTLGIGLLFQL